MVKDFKPCCLPVAMALVMFLSVACEGAQNSFAKSEDLPALRLRYSDLEDVLAKASRLATEANKQVVLSSNFITRFTADYGHEYEKGEALRFAEKQRENVLKQFPREGIVISAAGEELSLADHSLANAIRLPKAASSMTYRYEFYSEPMAITGISLRFDDYSRKIEVTGNSAEHVDAVMNTLRTDLLAYSTGIGGSRFRMWAGIVAVCVLAVLLNISIALVSKRRSFGWVLLICSVVSFLAVMLLPFDRWLPGFAAYREDPTFLVRYGSEIGFAGLLVSTLGVMIGVYQLFTAKNEASPAKKRLVKRTARSKSESAQS